ncbi:flavodoxin domain-containing protein [Roseateles albus]|uniref:Flavodoxin domain-containing protein n=1 Tax=Roseateles albus TaxID=2987525 RepID=A0ABT5KM01_9BURK|nr:flavodoxin domain-containing protein [Roseateles albus]MDC8774437.1 flavodoxin domain-containing protein [Roseateles albus]
MYRGKQKVESLYHGLTERKTDMLPVLIAYGTTEGQTRKVAEFIAERLRIRGHQVDLLDTASAAADQVQPFQLAVIACGSLHLDRHQSSLAHFLKSNQAWLQTLPLAFFSVSLSAAMSDADSRKEAQQAADHFMLQCDLQPLLTRCVAGALKYTQYDYFKRMMMRLIASHQGQSSDIGHDHEYTDWPQLEADLDQFLNTAGLAPKAHAA